MRQAWQWTEIKQKHHDLKMKFLKKFSTKKNIHSSKNFKIIFAQVITKCIWTVEMAPEYEKLLQKLYSSRKTEVSLWIWGVNSFGQHFRRFIRPLSNP